MPNAVLAFDMDGVLVEVGDSYRETICRTVEHFTGRKITRALVEEYKNRGGANNDWALSQRIAADLGAEVPYDTVVEHFQSIFIGNGTDGLILRERWMPQPGLLDALAQRFDLALFTGRPRAELSLTLRRFDAVRAFDPIVGAEDVAHGKPAPDGLLRIAAVRPGQKLWYVGDTVDDARSARAAGAAFIGIAAPTGSRRAELVTLFEAENAVAVLENVNQLPEVLP